MTTSQVSAFDPIAVELSAPATDGSRYDWEAIAQKATSQDRWLLIDNDGVPATVTRVNNDEVGALRDVEGWRFRCRATDVTKGPHRRCRLWIKAIKNP